MVDLMIRVDYNGPPHPLLGLVSMLEDADYEVTYDPPDLSAQEPVEVVLSITDIQLKGVDGVEGVIREFNDRHTELPVTIRIQPPA
jgi:hypothetical protein